MPPLNLTASSSATAKGGDGAFGGSTSAIQQGDWNANFGSGGVTTSSTGMMMLAMAAGAVWLLRRKA